MKHKRIINRVTAMVLAAAFVLSDAAILPNNVFAVSESAAQTSRVQAIEKDNDIIVNKSNDTAISTESVSSVQSGEKTESSSVADSSSLSETKKDDSTVIKVDSKPQPESKTESKAESKADVSSVKKSPKQLSKLSVPKRSAKTSISLFGAENSDAIGGDCSYSSSDSVAWSYDPLLKILTISGKGKMKDNCSSLWNTYEIENVIVEEGVTNIGSNAFSGCSKFTGEIKLPSTVTNIGERAFFNSKVTKVTCDDNIKSLYIGRMAFYGCSSMTDLHLSENLTSLSFSNSSDAYTFNGCSNLKELMIPGGIVNLNMSQFSTLSALEKITISEGITQISDGIFDGSKNSLKEVYLPSTLKTISNGLFEGYSKLEKVNPDEDCNINIPEGVETVDSFAFNGCSNLSGKVMFPSTLKRINNNAFTSDNRITELIFNDKSTALYLGNNAFNGCASLSNIHFSNNLNALTYSNSSSNYIFSGCTNLKELNIPGGIGTIPTYLFYTIPALEKITVGEGITQINDGAFDSSASTLKEVYLPSTLTVIANGLFQNYSKLEKINPTEDCNINIPEGVETIDSNAFYGCSSLSGKVIFPSTLKKINDNAFFANEKITDFIFNDESTELYLVYRAFGNCTLLSNIHFSDKLKNLTCGNSYYNNIFSGCTNLKELNIPGSIGTFATYLFNSAPALEKITVGEGITQINDGSFDSSATTLKEVHIPSTLTVIANGLFQNYSKLEKINPTEDCNINIPEGVETIDSNAFYGCSSLSGKVIFPSTLKKINDNAFFANEKITDFIFNDESTELYLVYRAFGNCTLLSNIHFSDKLKNLTCGNSYYNNIFSGCTNLKELNIPGSIGTFATYLFNSAPALEKITVGEGITQINDGSFDGSATTLKEVHLPSTLTVIANGLFQNYSKLERINPTEDYNINIPEGVETIDSYAFQSCKSLVGKMKFPSTLRNINSYAFHDCTELTGDNGSLFTSDLKIENIGYYAFSGCTKLNGHLYLPDSLKIIDSYAFRDTNFTDVHTPLSPFYVNNYYGAITSNNLWFRGTDDTETVVINNTTYDWSSFMDKWTARADNPKLYIDSTAKHLTSKNFWKKFTDVNFIGPNVIRLEITENSKDKDIFSGTQDPLASLDGTYYVTEQGVLYLLDPVRKSAALAYCPAGITELDIPAGFTVPEGMAQESKYEGKYQVASVLSHSILMASDLTTVNAAQPKKIVLNSKAFADCPTLTKVNGVTTQKEANALFGPYGTLSIKSAFVNTGLTADSGETGGGEQTGRPMRYLTYTPIRTQAD